jgi:outer membrane lipoprotein SlyB
MRSMSTGTIALLVAAGIGLGACQSDSKALRGAGVGAAGGAAVGAIAGDTLQGAAIGAAGGAITGAILDEKDRKREQDREYRRERPRR